MRKCYTVLTGIFFVLLFTTCKQFTTDIDEYLSYWAAEAFIKSSNIEAATQTDITGMVSVASANDVTVTLKVQNPKSFRFVMPSSSETRNIVNFAHLTGATPAVGTDYELKQIAGDTLNLIYKAGFLKNYEWGRQDLSSTIKLYADDGRPFKQTFTVNIKANTPPPLPVFTVAKTAGTPAYYVLCIRVPEMDAPVQGGLLHKDLTRIEINGTSYALSVNEKQHAFVKPEDGNFITAGEVERIPEPDASPVPAGGWILYYKTDVEVKEGAVKKEYTVRLADAGGLVSQILNASTKPNKAEHENIHITKGNLFGGSGSESEPVVIGTNSEGAELAISSPTANTTVHCTVSEIGGSVTRYNGNPVTIPLPLNGAGEKKYKLEYYTDGEGFAATPVKTVYYRIAVIHTVTFDANGGTYEGGATAVSQTALHGTVISAPNPLPEKSGYGLTGWYKDAVCTPGQKWNFETDTVTGDITLYAQWTAGEVSYKVEHYQEKLDGTFTTEIENKTGITGQPALYNPKTDEGFTYQPNRTEINGIQQLSGLIAGNGSTVVKLYYQRNTITVTFKLNGGKVDGNTSDVTRTGKYGATFTAPAVERAGYRLSGWQPDGDAPTEVPSTFPAKDAAYTAQWTPAGNTPYKVMHHKESVSGGTYVLADTDNETGTTGANAAVTLKSYIGFEDGTYSPATIAADGTTTVTVCYNRKTINLRFKLNGGNIDGNTSDVVRSGKFDATFTAPANPDKTGYTFSRWDSALPSPLKFPLNNTTYTAQWTANTYYVRFNGNGNTGGGMSDQTFNYGTATALSANGFRKTGHTFEGWATSPTGTRVYGNRQSVSNLTASQNGIVTLYAVWKIETYSVTFSVADGEGELNGVYGSQNETALSGGGGKTLNNVPYGATVNFTATAAAGWEVDSWTFDGSPGSGASSSATLPVDAPKTVTVKFKPGVFNLTGGGPDAWKRLKEEAAKTKGSHTIVINGEIEATGGDNTGEITLGRNLTIKGGSGAVLNANGITRIFKVENGKTLTLEDITLQNAQVGSTNEGGGVYIDNGCTLIMQGSSTITNCKAGKGGGVYVNGTFKMEGSAVVTAESNTDNEVYLESGKTVTVTGALTSTPAAKIRVADYQKNRVLAVGERAKKENFRLAPDSGKNWRYKKVGDEIKFVTGKLTYTIEKIISIEEHDNGNGSDAEYYWTMQINGKNVSKRTHHDSWKPETKKTKKKGKVPELEINGHQTVLFNYTDKETVGAYFLIKEEDHGLGDDDTVANVTKDITYENDQLKFEGNTISFGQEENFRLEFHGSGEGDVDVVCRIGWGDE